MTLPAVVPADSEGQSAALEALRDGGLVALPTETVYGLAALPGVEGAMERLFAAKDRPDSVAIAILVADAEQASELTESSLPRRLVERHWPGPLTVVVRRRPDLSWNLGGDPATIGLRCPDHSVAHSLCRAAGPLATTSANLHGQPTPASAEEVAAVFEKSGVSLVLDGGECAGRPSTVVDLTGDQPRVLREGAVAEVDLLP